MSFTLKHREQGSRGSFVAWGMGLRYEYDPAPQVLTISDAGKNRPLLYLDFDEDLSDSALFYTQILEKTTQTEALLFSNNTTVDLSEIFDDGKLIPILESSVRIARYGFDLKRGFFLRFTSFFCEDFLLKSLSIQAAARKGTDKPLYFATLQTINNHAITSCAPDLHTVMTELSQKTVHDLIAAELGCHMQTSAHNLLRLSSKLNILGRILDNNHMPENFLLRPRIETECVTEA